MDETRADMTNWSDVEVLAFTAATKAAAGECARMETTAYEGEELLSLAKLCALGQNWNGTYSAALRYTRMEEAAHLASGFGLLLQADLNQAKVADAIDHLTEMTKRLPLSMETNAVYAYALAAIEVTRPEDGIRVALLRQPMSLAALNQSTATMFAGVAEADAWHTLSLLHFAHKTAEERAQMLLLQDAIAKRTVPLGAADAYTAALGRARYACLGKPLPHFNAVRNTYAPVKAADKAISAELVVLLPEGSPGVPVLALAVDRLRLRLGMRAQATLVLLSPKSAPKVPAGSKAVVHAVTTREPLLEELGFEGAPVFVVLDDAKRVAFAGVGTAAWLSADQQAELLMERTIRWVDERAGRPDGML